MAIFHPLTGRPSHSQVARKVPQLQAADQAAAREAVDALAAAIGEAAAATGAREDEERGRAEHAFAGGSSRADEVDMSCRRACRHPSPRRRRRRGV